MHVRIAVWASLCVPLLYSIGGQIVAVEPDPWTLLASGEARWTAPVSYFSDDSDTSRTIASDEQMAEVRLIYRPHIAVRVGAGVAVEHGNYVDDDSNLGVRATWVRVPAALMFSQHWGVSTLTSFGSATAEDVPVTHDHRWMIQAGPVWVRDKSLIIGLFANYATRIGQRASVFPFPAVEWQIAPAWHLTIVDELDSISRLTWQVEPRFALGVRVDVRLREYRISDDQQRALTDDQAALAFETTWCPASDNRLRLTLFTGAALVRRLTYLQDGDTVLSETAGPAFQAGLMARSEF